MKCTQPFVASDLSGRLLPFLIKTNNEVSWGENKNITCTSGQDLQKKKKHAT